MYLGVKPKQLCQNDDKPASMTFSSRAELPCGNPGTAMLQRRVLLHPNRAIYLGDLISFTRRAHAAKLGSTWTPREDGTLPHHPLHEEEERP